MAALARRLLTPVGLGLALAALVAASLAVGAADLAGGDAGAAFLLAASRAPRTLAALLTGASLAVAGLIMQMLAANRFVEPTTSGAAQGAALGLLAVTLWAPEAATGWKMAAAAVASMAGSAVFLAMIRRLPPTEPLMVPLVGLAWGAVLGAAGGFVAWEADLLQLLEIWTAGEFSGVIRGRYELLWLTAALTAVAWLAADRFAIAGLGRETATGLGLNHARVMALGLAIVSAITALVVSTVGMLPFVGLVAPNLVSRVMGDNLRRTLPSTALLGATLTLACDVAGRLAIRPYEVPAGTLFGVIGAGLFLWLLFAPPPPAEAPARTPADV